MTLSLFFLLQVESIFGQLNFIVDIWYLVNLFFLLSNYFILLFIYPFILWGGVRPGEWYFDMIHFRHTILLINDGHLILKKDMNVLMKQIFILYQYHLLIISLHINSLNTLRTRQDGRHFPDDIFKCIYFNENL